MGVNVNTSITTDVETHREKHRPGGAPARHAERRRARGRSRAHRWAAALPRLTFWFILAAVVTALAGCSRPGGAPGVSVRTSFALGTLVQIRAYGSQAREAVSDAFDRIEAVEALMSANVATSDVAAVNREAGGLPTRVADDTLYVIKKARGYGDLSRGRFDMAIGPLVRLWGIGTNHARVPSPEEVAAARSLIDHRDVEIDETRGTVRLRKAGMALDLGAIAKGFAADRAAEALLQQGVKSAFIDLGGNILVLGSKPDGSPWRVGIQDPWKERGATFAVVPVRDMAVVSSGTYERFFEQAGTRYHHIIDPDTGYPAETGIVSATVLARHAVDADALSTTVFLLGPSDGMRLVTQLPGVEAVIVTHDRQVVASPGLRGVIEVSKGWTIRFYGASNAQKS